MTHITTELCIAFGHKTIRWLLFLWGVSTDIGWLNITRGDITPSLAGKVGPQYIAMIHSDQVLNHANSIGPIACHCTALALFPDLNVDSGRYWRSRGKRHHRLACTDRLTVVSLDVTMPSFCELCTQMRRIVVNATCTFESIS